MSPRRGKVYLNSNYVRDVLMRRNLDQNAFAASIHVSRSYLCQLLAGTRHPSPRVRARLMSELQETNFDQLFRQVTGE